MSIAVELVGGPMDGELLEIPEFTPELYFPTIRVIQASNFIASKKPKEPLPIGRITYAATGNFTSKGWHEYNYKG